MCYILVGQNKSLVFIFTFITIFEAYLTPDGKNTPKAQNPNKVILQLL